MIQEKMWKSMKSKEIRQTTERIFIFGKYAFINGGCQFQNRGGFI